MSAPALAHRPAGAAMSCRVDIADHSGSLPLTTKSVRQCRPVSLRLFSCPKFGSAPNIADFRRRDDRSKYNTRKGNKASASQSVVESRHLLIKGGLTEICGVTNVL